MIDRKHSDETREFFKKIMLFIDNSVLNAINSDAGNTNKILLSCLHNIKDSLISEIVSDNVTTQFQNAFLKQQSDITKKKEENLKEQRPEKELDIDQKN
jgi:hypothetical protein